MTRLAITMAITALFTLTAISASAEGRRKDIDHVGLYNFVIDGTFIIDPTYFPEGPIGFPEGPIGSVRGDVEGEYRAESDGPYFVDFLATWHAGSMDAVVEMDREGRLTVAGQELSEDSVRALADGRTLELQWSLTCSSDSPIGISPVPVPSSLVEEPCPWAIHPTDDAQCTFQMTARGEEARPVSLMCAVDAEEAPGFGSDDFLSEFDLDIAVTDDEVERAMGVSCAM